MVIEDTQALHTVFSTSFEVADMERKEHEIAVEFDNRMTSAMKDAAKGAVERLAGMSIEVDDGYHGRGGSGLDFGDAIPASMTDPVVVGVDVETEDIEFDLQDELDGETALHSTVVPAVLEIEGFADRGDALPGDSPFDWVGTDWESPSIEVGLSISVELAVNLTVTNETVVSTEVDYVI